MGTVNHEGAPGPRDNGNKNEPMRPLLTVLFSFYAELDVVIVLYPL